MLAAAVRPCEGTLGLLEVLCCCGAVCIVAMTGEAAAGRTGMLVGCGGVCCTGCTMYWACCLPVFRGYWGAERPAALGFEVIR